MTTHTPTPEQQDIIDAATGTTENIMVKAYAGCTKTTTLQMLMARMRPTPTLALAFNKKIAQELEKVFPPFVTVKTMNALGMAAWAKARGRETRLTVDDRKVGKLIKIVLAENGFQASEEQWTEIKDWVDAARLAGLVPAEWSSEIDDLRSASARRFPGLVPDEAAVWESLSDQPRPDMALAQIAREVLRQSCEAAFAGEIDFDDMIYCSTLLGGIYPQFPLVLVDEAQDLSPLNHRQVAMALAPKGRLIVVGDPKQAIYAFRGADSESMAKLKALRQSWLILPLNTTFRCPKVVVRRNVGHAPGFVAWPTNREGLAVDWTPKASASNENERLPLEHPSGEKADGWSWPWLRSLAEPGDQIAVLCRNNAPLLGLAFKLIRQGVAPHMMGRDIGKGLVALARKIGPKAAMPRGEFLEAVERWRVGEKAKARDAEKEHLVAGIEDRAECLIAVADGLEGEPTAGDIREAIARLFSREFGDVILASGHRAKGLEWAVVLHLDPQRIPSRFAKKAAQEGDYGQLRQEENLRYVMETRTKKVFVEAKLEDFL